MILCVCGAGKFYDKCCGQYLSGKLNAPTPEALMRSRYVAYTQGNIDYIQATMCGNAAIGFDPSSAKQWAKTVVWDHLEVIEANQVAAMNATKGYVEFIANYFVNSHLQKIHEISEFHLINRRWYYVDGKILP